MRYSWLEKAREFQKNTCFCFTDFTKAFDCADHNKLKIQMMGIPDQLACLLRNLYAGQEATVRTGNKQQTGSKLGKDYVKAVYCHPTYLTYSGVQFSRSVVSDSLRPHESQHARPPCPSPTPGVYSNSCPLSWWCHPAISSSVILFSSYPQSFPA